jgi:hypothetical protein
LQRHKAPEHRIKNIQYRKDRFFYVPVNALHKPHEGNRQTVLSIIHFVNKPYATATKTEYVICSAKPIS